MKSTVEPIEGNKVKLSIQVDSDSFEHEIDAAFKRIASEVRLPGFRPGKAPRKVLEARIGLDAARMDAIEHAVSKYYAEAIEEHDVDVIAAPEIDITAGREEGDVAFDAVVEIRPTVNPAGYDSLRVTIDSPLVSDEDLEGRLDRLREGYARLETVERAAQVGDSVTIDVVGSRDGEPLEGLVADGYLYEVGSGSVVPELDENLVGAEAGQTLTFTADHPDEGEDPVDFEVKVTEVKEKVLPEADDAFAAEASEFETLDELSADLREKLAGFKRYQAQIQIHQRTADALAELVDEDIPEPLVDTEMRNRLQELAMRLQAQGFSVDDYLQSLGQGAESFNEEMKEAAVRGVKVDLALRAVAEAEGIEVDDDDLEAEWEAVAARVGRKPAQVKKDFERGGQVSAVRSDLRNRRAMQWLIERVELVDESGSPVDRASLEVAPDADAEATTEDTE
jgi:trigger factor